MPCCLSLLECAADCLTCGLVSYPYALLPVRCSSVDVAQHSRYMLAGANLFVAAPNIRSLEGRLLAAWYMKLVCN